LFSCLTSSILSISFCGFLLLCIIINQIIYIFIWFICYFITLEIKFFTIFTSPFLFEKVFYLFRVYFTFILLNSSLYSFIYCILISRNSFFQ
jgi:hypothetical protein